MAPVTTLTIHLKTATELCLDSDEEGTLVVFSHHGGKLHHSYEKLLAGTRLHARLNARLKLKVVKKKSFMDQGSQKHFPFHSGSCRSMNYTIDFRLLGLSDLIIHPLTYKDNMCSGDCSGASMWLGNASPHAIIQTLSARQNPDITGPACVAIKLAPLRVLYIDDGYLVTEQLPDILATECGCR
jgi:hypothetical protein